MNKHERFNLISSLRKGERMIGIMSRNKIRSKSCIHSNSKPVSIHARHFFTTLKVRKCKKEDDFPEEAVFAVDATVALSDPEDHGL